MNTSASCAARSPWTGADHLSSILERIDARALPLATRNFEICVSSLWPDSGVHGLAHEVGELVLTGA